MNLKEINISICTFYYFDDTMRVIVIDFNNILLDKKPNENILVYIILYRKFKDAKSLRIRFHKVNGLIKFYNGIRYLELSESYNEVCYGINSRIYCCIINVVLLAELAKMKP